MIRIKSIITILSMICFLQANAQETDKGQMEIALTNPGKSYKLKVSLLDGSVKLTAHSGSNIIVDVTAHEGKSKPAKEAGGMKRIGGSTGFEVKAKENNNEVEISNSNVMKKIDLDIKVPANGNFQVKLINNGDIEIVNVQGELELSNINGAIRLSGVRGSAVANTINGEIIARFQSVSPDKAMAFSTLNGKIDVSFPADIKANMKLRSDYGEVYSDFDVALEKNAAPVSKTQSNGLYKISKDAWLNGKINGGGPDIMLKTSMGSIYLRKNK